MDEQDQAATESQDVPAHADEAPPSGAVKPPEIEDPVGTIQKLVAQVAVLEKYVVGLLAHHESVTGQKIPGI